MNFKRKIFYFRNEVNNETTKIVYSFIYAAFFVLALSFSDLTLKAESTNQNVQLQDIFSRSETKILKVDFEQSQKKEGEIEYTINLGRYGKHHLVLEENDMLSYNLKQKIKRQSNKNEVNIARNYRGKIANQPNSKVALTVNRNFISGFIEYNETSIYFEPLYHFSKNAKTNEIIIYNKNDVKTQAAGCAHKHEPASLKVAQQAKHLKKSAANCTDFTVQIFLVAAYDMFKKYLPGSTREETIEKVENRMVSALNGAEENFDDEFSNPIKFEYDTYIATSASEDKWDPELKHDSLLLKAFAESNFTDEHYDLASLWVARDIYSEENNGVKDHSIVGLARRGGLCGYRYNLIEDKVGYQTSSAKMTTIFAHEIGHNFGATHDPQGNTIMTPTIVNSSNVWSQTSKDEINAFYPKATCLCKSYDAVDWAIKSCGSYSLSENTLTISNVEIKNIGPLPNGFDVKTSWYLSTDNTINTDDYPIIEATPMSYDSGEDYIYNDIKVDLNTLVVPPDNYYLGAITDSGSDVTEYCEENNVCIMSPSANITIVATPPDLQATCINLGISIVSPDIPVTSRYYVINVENRGTTASVSSTLGLYLSCDDIVNTEDFQILTETIPALSGGDVRQFRILFDRSTTYLPAGNYTLGFIVDANEEITESNESNNVSCPREITIEQNPTIFGDGVGDVNLDGVINILDAYNVSQYVVRTKKIGNCSDLNTGDNLCLTNGDITGDCIINILDARRISECAVGLPGSCP